MDRGIFGSYIAEVFDAEVTGVAVDVPPYFAMTAALACANSCSVSAPLALRAARDCSSSGSVILRSRRLVVSRQRHCKYARAMGSVLAAPAGAELAATYLLTYATGKK